MEETVEIPLGGMDAFTDAKHVRPGKLAVINNGRFSRPPGISKRNGFVALTTETNNDEGSILIGTRIAHACDELLLFTERQLFAYSLVLQKWVLKGIAGETIISRRPVFYEQSTDIMAATVSLNNAYLLHAWGEYNPSAGAFRACVTDLFGTVLATSDADYGPEVRTFALGNYLYLVHLDGSTPATFKVLRILAVGATDITIPAAVNFAATIDVVDNSAGRLFDARELERAAPDATRRFILAYREEDGGGSFFIRVRLFDDAFPPVQIWQQTIDDIPGSMLTVLGREGENVYVAWDGDGELTPPNVIRCAVLNATTGAIVAGPNQVNTGLTETGINRGSLVRHSATQALLVWEVSRRFPGPPPPGPSLFLPHTRWRRIGNDSLPIGDEKFAYDCAMVSRPWDFGGRYYVATVFHEAEQGTGFVLEIGNGTDGQLSPRWSGTFGRFTASGILASDATYFVDPFNVNNVVSNANPFFGTVLFDSLHKHKFSKNRTPAVTASNSRELRDEIRFHRGVHLTSVEFMNPCRFQGAQWHHGYLVAGGKPGWYDKYQLTEHGFAWFPSYDRDKSTASPATTDDVSDVGSGLLGAGDYLLCSIFEHEDANGMLTRSGVSRIMEHTTGAASRTLVVERTSGLLTDRVPTADAWWATGFSRPREIFFRTRVNEVDLLRATGPYGVALTTNPTDVTPETVIIAANTAPDESDDGIADNELLYTTGDILANDGPPACRFACVHGDRMWLGGLENPREMWFSQPFVETETPRFNGNLRLAFDKRIINAGSMDDKLCCFAGDRIYVVTGRGPSAAGGVDIGFEIQLVTSDVGILDFSASEMRSLVETPLGIMFRSSKGIYLLDRALGLKFVGREVASLLTIDDTCVGACVKQDTNEVYFAFTPRVEANSYLLIYNYLLDVWYRDTLNFRAASIATVPAPLTGDHQIAILRESGIVYLSDPAGYNDVAIGGTLDGFIQLYIELPWLKPSELLQGWCELKEILLLGTAPVDVDFQLRVRVFYDYNEDEADPSTFDDVLFTEAEIQPLTENVPLSRFQLSISPRIQQCQAFKIKIVDEESGDGPDQGYTLHSIVLKFIRRPGTAHTHAGARH